MWKKSGNAMPAGLRERLVAVHVDGSAQMAVCVLDVRGGAGDLFD